MLGGTYVVEQVALSRIQQADTAELLEQELDWLSNRIHREEQALLHRARLLAQNAVLHEALRDSSVLSNALNYFARIHLPDGVSAELFTPRPELVAWKGPAFPLDPAVQRLGFVDHIQSALVDDAGVRRALVVWHPVKDGNRVIGVVRVSRMLSVQVPVRNQYLRDLDLIADWTRNRSAQLQLILPGDQHGNDDPASIRELPTLDGHVLGWISAQPLSVESRRAGISNTFAQVRSFFATLLLGVFVAAIGVIQWYWIRDGQQGRVLAALTVFLIVLWVYRYALLIIGMPDRMAGFGAAPPIFAPSYLGSGWAGGLAGSIAEVMITGFFLGISGAVVFAAGRFLYCRRKEDTSEVSFSPVALGMGVIAGITGIFAALLIQRTTTDSTLAYLDRAGPVADPLILLVLGAWFVGMFGVVMVMGGLLLIIRKSSRWLYFLAVLIVAISGVVITDSLIIGMSVLGMLILGGVVARLSALRISSPYSTLDLRTVVFGAVALSLLIYPLIYSALQQRERVQLLDAMEDFAAGEDPRVAFALESVLLDARASGAVQEVFQRMDSGESIPPDRVDIIAAELVSGSLLTNLAHYRVGLTLHNRDGQPIGQFYDALIVGSEQQQGGPAHDPFAFSRLSRLYQAEAGFAGFAVERRPTALRTGTFRYFGIGPVRSPEDQQTIGWITARAEPLPARYIAETPFPRVLVPAGLYRLEDDQWSFAEFIDGQLQRSRGMDFVRLSLPEEIEILPVGQVHLRMETHDHRPVQVLYRKLSADRVVAARMPAVTVLDHLFFLLRTIIPGLLIGGFLLGIQRLIRTQRKEPLPRLRLRDRVLNRFLLIGLLAAVATGMIAREVIVTQNQTAVETWLKGQLGRLEALLYDDFTGQGMTEEMSLSSIQILNRIRPELVASRAGLDVAVYRGADLVASSQSHLARNRLIEPRLPVEVAQKLLVDGERYAFATVQMGLFTYTTGFEMIPGEDGSVPAILAIPTLPEQAAIEADQARMIAWLFGVMLLLVPVIYVFATVLANRLTSPFRRLREGLRAVGAGQSTVDPIPVEQHDEIGEVIETFNAVQMQLEESRRRLAAQERELAWREMARQVAHEIKNPLTPMRLSVQRLRKVYQQGQEERFTELFEPVSGTLLEQIDALNRIAGEFSHFGRLPAARVETFDLNDIIRQAAALVGEEPQADIILELTTEPLPVRADREELRRAFINLLKNAEQAMPDNHHGRIVVGSQQKIHPIDSTHWAECSIEDNGSGIPEELRPKIFQPNFSTRTSGMGLGLAITRKTIEDFRGEISFVSETGKGTVFVVRLPLEL